MSPVCQPLYSRPLIQPSPPTSASGQPALLPTSVHPETPFQATSSPLLPCSPSSPAPTPPHPCYPCPWPLAGEPARPHALSSWPYTFMRLFIHLLPICPLPPPLHRASSSVRSFLGSAAGKALSEVRSGEHGRWVSSESDPTGRRGQQIGREGEPEGRGEIGR